MQGLFRFLGRTIDTESTEAQCGKGRIGGRHTLEFMSDLKTIAFNLQPE